MKFYFILMFILAMMGLGVVNIWAQPNSSTEAEKKVNWQPVSVKNEEFIAYLPAGFETVSDGNFTMGSNQARVKKKVVAWRYINGVALIFEYYDGDGDRLLNSLVERDSLSLEKVDTANNCTVKTYLGPLRSYFIRKQIFLCRNRVYVIKGIAKSAGDKILGDFFNAATLINNKVVIYPNLEKDNKSLAFSDIIELPPSLADDSTITPLLEADRAPIVLYKQRPKFPASKLGYSAVVRLRILLSASGKVTDFDVNGNAPKAFMNAAVAAAKKIRFIPAEKNGKLVSVYQTLEFSFDSYY